MIHQRRVFLMTITAGSAALVTAGCAEVRLDEKEPKAIAVGYVADATQTDTKKFPMYVAGQNCANCDLYKASPSDPWGGCPLFGSKLVAGAGWCNAWKKE